MSETKFSGPWPTMDEAKRAAERLNDFARSRGLMPLTWFIYQKRRAVFDISPIPFRSYKTVALVGVEPMPAMLREQAI